MGTLNEIMNGMSPRNVSVLWADFSRGTFELSPENSTIPKGVTPVISWELNGPIRVRWKGPHDAAVLQIAILTRYVFPGSTYVSGFNSKEDVTLEITRDCHQVYRGRLSDEIRSRLLYAAMEYDHEDIDFDTIRFLMGVTSRNPWQ